MSHELTIRENGMAEFVSGRNITPWHGLGQRVEGLMTAVDCIKLAGLDWTASLQPVTVLEKVADDYKAVCRDDTKECLSIVGNRYHIIQNRDCFNFFDEVIGAGQAYYDTAGSLFGGKKVFITAKIPGKLFLKNNPNDKIEKFVLLHTSHDGTSSLVMQIVSVRVVCQNTLTMALQDASNVIKLRHTKGYEDKVSQVQETLGLMTAYYDNLQAVIDSLSNERMNESQAVDFVETLIPSQEKGEDVPTRTQNTRQEILKLFRHGVGNEGKTRWDMLNGVTEFVSHHRSTRTSEGKNEDENKFSSIMFGSGATLSQKAFNLLAS